MPAMTNEDVPTLTMNSKDLEPEPEPSLEPMPATIDEDPSGEHSPMTADPATAPAKNKKMRWLGAAALATGGALVAPELAVVGVCGAAGGALVARGAMAAGSALAKKRNRQEDAQVGDVGQDVTGEHSPMTADLSVNSEDLSNENSSMTADPSVMPEANSEDEVLHKGYLTRAFTKAKGIYKENASAITGKEDAQFGEVAQTVLKKTATSITGKEDATGCDVAKTVATRVATGGCKMAAKAYISSEYIQPAMAAML